MLGEESSEAREARLAKIESDIQALAKATVSVSVQVNALMNNIEQLLIAMEFAGTFIENSDVFMGDDGNLYAMEGNITWEDPTGVDAIADANAANDTGWGEN